ncbi:alpha-L-rhamnosidase [Aureimonas sp. AU40]|uniref:alpha-L-rhamnosidase n=1 Tax=Aureimonas sp. AU40 TaxID=1637747 RepID=UPI000783912F|nr:alpha-L-rhamnosidase [Aureimonas sp. AU40]
MDGGNLSIGAPGADHANWTARMIHPLSDGGVGTPASFLRRRFTLDGVSGAETLRISALGLYRCFINGRRVGEDLLTPGWTSYDRRLSYQTYPVSDLLTPGENTIEIWLADGWYRSQIMWGQAPIFNCWGDKTGVIAELRARADGALLLATDASWRSGLLPILASGLYFGETFDARRTALEETHGAEALAFDTSLLLPHETQPVRELAALEPIAQTRDAEGRAIYDFGQNAAGYIAFEVEGEPGAKVIVEHSEILDRDGHFENSNYRTAEARITYILRGEGPEAFRPHFTFQGFRYARVSIEGRAMLRSIRSVPISSVYPQRGRFTCGHPLVNRLVENTLWSQRSNFIEVPTDCPQRDERLGWTGDAQVFAPTACYLHDSHDFLRKWLRDVMADQRADGAIPHVVPDPTRLHPDLYPGFFGSTGWGDAIAIVPWTLYLHYGDLDILAETLPAMVRWVDFVWSISDGPIVRPPRQWGARGFTFGDWLQPKGPSAKPLPTIGDEAAATIYLFITSSLVSRIARLVGDEATAERMRERAECVRRAFADEFVTPAGRVGNDDQTSYALAVLHDLVPPERLGAVRANFRNAIARSEGRIGTGFIGTPALLPALVKLGETGLASQVFLQEDVPGWLYQVKQGATTIWERWDAIQVDGSVFDPQMNSYNHYAYGAVCQWLFEAVAGLRPDPDAPGFGRVIFEPLVLPALGHARAEYESRLGTVQAAWRVDDEGMVDYDIVLPAGSSGLLRLPAGAGEATLGGQPVSADGETALAAGHHRVRFCAPELRPGLPAFAAHTSRTP